jgi:zinc D-Ala-D-Ala carboxypeptidase
MTSERVKIQDNFYKDEITCNCGCGEDRISSVFMRKLQSARRVAGIPFIINRGVSCPEHNKAVGGSEKSAHVPEHMPDDQGHAVDIAVNASRQRYLIIRSALTVGINRIGVYKGFIHLDDADAVDAKSRDLIWWA